jgi:diguanylate cyclase (GGDEF)-like protein
MAWMLISNLRHRRELMRLANQDALTGLPNRRRTTELARAALHAATFGHRPVTIALLDLDHFKSINDRCGHAVGDHVLTEFARLARQELRSSDTLGRRGGEEFLLALPDTPLDTAIAVIQRMRLATANIQLPESARGLKVSFSAGLATRTRNVQSPNEIISCADAALYDAKHGGRNLLRLDHETYRTAASGVLQALYGDSIAGRS